MSTKYQMPDAWTTKPQSTKVFAGHDTPIAKDEPKQVLAKIDMGEQVAGAGMCPSCRKPMERGYFAGSVPVMVCFDDRVTLPVPDGQENVEANSETGFDGVSYVNN